MRSFLKLFKTGGTALASFTAEDRDDMVGFESEAVTANDVLLLGSEAGDG